MAWPLLTPSATITSIVFDLDGTLYSSEALQQEVATAAEELVAETRGVSRKEGKQILACAERRLSEILGEEPTLTHTCLELGISLIELHQAFIRTLRPERHLDADPILSALLDALQEHCDLYIYTNNNLALTRKILALLGVESYFKGLYTIEFTAAPKPDPAALHQVLEDIGGPPESFLFVGDRPQVDLKEPAALGIATLVVRETADLLQIHRLLNIIP